MSADTIAAAVQTVERGFSSFRSDLRAIDEPLQFCLNGSPSLDYHALPRFRLDLTVGFLFTDGIIDNVRQILSMRAESADNTSGDSGDRVTIGLGPYCDPAEMNVNPF